MRWSTLSIETDGQAHLPGYREPAVVRHFEPPEGVSTRFYEVRARSILNRVPAASRMPFRWTVNPYRGCTHACTYCVGGATPVLMGNGSHRPIEALEVGDEIYGTVSGSVYRRYAKTLVWDKWISVEPAYRVVLADGTELIASGDHRFLTDRGWKHVVNSAPHLPDRAHLTPRNRLVGTGAFAAQPTESSEYRRGYLCGMIRGDGHLRSYVYARPSGGRMRVNSFRLALTDREALQRARDYLAVEHVETRQWSFSASTATHFELLAIDTATRGAVDRISSLIDWPVLPGSDWVLGFLAGIYDAEGSRSAFALRIANTDAQILDWTSACLRRFGFDVAHDRTTQPNGLVNVRVRGGLSEHLRFFHLTNPAIARKRAIEGQMVKTFVDLTVVAVEPLGCELPLYDISTGTGDFIADGVVSHNCFARPTHSYLGFDAGRDFEREIVVKVNAPERLRAELARPSWRGEHVALGTNTDPYQWVEGRYRLMPGIWEALRDARNECSVLTKSPLLLRDLPLLRELDRVTEFTAALSVPTLDERAWRATEPHTPNPRARLEAIAELARAGIRTGVLVAPLMPGINDAPEQVAEILRLAEEAGAAYVTGIALHLRSGTREVFFDWLREHRPELVERYERLYRLRAYAPPAERRRLARLLEGDARGPRAGGSEPADSDWMGGRVRTITVEAGPRREGEQERLF